MIGNLEAVLPPLSFHYTTKQCSYLLVWRKTLFWPQDLISTISISTSWINDCHHPSGLHYYCVTSIYLGILPARPPSTIMTHFPKRKLRKVERSIFRVAKQLITKWSCFRSSRGGSDSSLVTCAGCAAAGSSYHRCQGWHFTEENPSKPPHRHEDAKSWFI